MATSIKTHFSSLEIRGHEVYSYFCCCRCFASLPSCLVFAEHVLNKMGVLGLRRQNNPLRHTLEIVGCIKFFVWLGIYVILICAGACITM